LGWPEFTQVTLASGTVTWNETTNELSIDRGIRQIEWMGSNLKELSNQDEDLTLTQQELDDIDSMATMRILSAILPRQYTVSADPLIKTKLFEDADEADMDLRSEIIIPEDVDRSMPAVTFGEASKKAASKTYNTVHVIDEFGNIDAENAKIRFTGSGGTYGVTLTVNGSTQSIAEYEDLWRYVWAGATIYDAAADAKFLEWLYAVTEAGAGDVERLDAHGDGENNDWNETNSWPRILDPSAMTESRRNAQEIMQFSRDRSQLSQFLFASIGQGKLAYKAFAGN
jgi:hypothetical protein